MGMRCPRCGCEIARMWFNLYTEMAADIEIFPCQCWFTEDDLEWYAVREIGKELLVVADKLEGE